HGPGPLDPRSDGGPRPRGSWQRAPGRPRSGRLVRGETRPSQREAGEGLRADRAPLARTADRALRAEGPRRVVTLGIRGMTWDFEERLKVSKDPVMANRLVIFLKSYFGNAPDFRATFEDKPFSPDGEVRAFRETYR